MDLQHLPKTPNGYHAFLLADIFVDDPGSGAYVDVIFLDGSRIRAKASPDVLRLGKNLQGNHRGTLHFRTDDNAKLIEPVHLYKIRNTIEPLPHKSGTFWTALGTEFNKEGAIRIYPEKARTNPFQISYVATHIKIPERDCVHVVGWLHNLHLVATTVTKIEDLAIPSRWTQWQW